MKKIIASIIILLLLLLSSYALYAFLTDMPSRITKSWQTITIIGIGTFRIPTDWHAEQQDGFLFITDKPLSEGSYTIYIVGALREVGFSTAHKIFEGVEQRNRLFFQILSNGASLHLYEYTVNETKEEFRMITLSNIASASISQFDLLVWNRDIVDEWLYEQIAKTFRTDREDYDNPNLGQLAVGQEDDS